MRIKLDSAFFFVGQAVARHMIARRRGKIINIDSLKSEAARYLIAPYTASKGAVKNLIKNNCADWARRGLQINAIGPVYFATPLNHALADNAEFDARLKHRTLGSHGRTAGAVVFLASAASESSRVKYFTSTVACSRRCEAHRDAMAGGEYAYE
jgi:gluconate 5-dehydrogenase